MSDDETRWIQDGLFTEYYQNGNISSTGLYDNGLENGHWINYHENGHFAFCSYRHLKCSVSI